MTYIPKYCEWAAIHGGKECKRLALFRIVSPRIKYWVCPEHLREHQRKEYLNWMMGVYRLEKLP